MRRWQEALVSLVCFLAIGCRTDPNITLLERENRELENTIYELQDCVDKYQRQLDACQRATAASQTKAGGTKGPETQGAAEAPSSRGTPPTPSRKSEPAPPVSKEELKPQEVEIPSNSSGTSKIPESLQAPAPSGPSNAPPPAKPKGSSTMAPPAGPDLSAPELLPVPQQPSGKQARRAGQPARPISMHSAQVAQIRLNPRSTGGFDQDSRDGDDGVSILIEPRDAQGRLCVAAAPISVVVADPSLPGDAARIARWDFTAEEIAGFLQNTRPGEGIRLTMLWPQAPPVHEQLHLFVRYVAENGQKLECDSPIKVAVHSQQARNWAPALLPKVSGSEAGQPVEAGPAPLSPTPTAQSQPRSSQPRPSSAPVALEAARPTWSPNRR